MRANRIHSLIACLIACLIAASARADDLRNVETGLVMPSLKYADQPYIAVTQTGRWVCVLTTGKGNEGAGGQHVAAAVSGDQATFQGPLLGLTSRPEDRTVVPLCPAEDGCEEICLHGLVQDKVRAEVVRIPQPKTNSLPHAAGVGIVLNHRHIRHGNAPLPVVAGRRDTHPWIGAVYSCGADRRSGNT